MYANAILFQRTNKKKTFDFLIERQWRGSCNEHPLICSGVSIKNAETCSKSEAHTDR